MVCSTSIERSKLEAAQASALAYWESLAKTGDMTQFQDFLQRAASSAKSHG